MEKWEWEGKTRKTVPLKVDEILQILLITMRKVLDRPGVLNFLQKQENIFFSIVKIIKKTSYHCIKRLIKTSGSLNFPSEIRIFEIFETVNFNYFSKFQFLNEMLTSTLISVWDETPRAGTPLLQLISEAPMNTPSTCGSISLQQKQEN